MKTKLIEEEADRIINMPSQELFLGLAFGVFIGGAMGLD